MCLAIPGKVLEIQPDAAGVRMARTDFAGVIKQVCLEYTPEVNCGDYILVHVGFALGKVDESEARRTYQALEDMNQLAELDVPGEQTGSGRYESAPLLEGSGPSATGRSGGSP